MKEAININIMKKNMMKKILFKNLDLLILI